LGDAKQTNAKEIPVEVLDIEDTVTAFAWEPGKKKIWRYLWRAQSFSRFL